MGGEDAGLGGYTLGEWGLHSIDVPYGVPY